MPTHFLQTIIILKMVPLINKSVGTLVGRFAKEAAAGESFEVFRYPTCITVKVSYKCWLAWPTAVNLSYVASLSLMGMYYSFRTYGSFTMETILATAFGRVIDIQRGESDELTAAVDSIFRGAQEGQSMDGAVLNLLISKSCWVWNATG